MRVGHLCIRSARALYVEQSWKGGPCKQDPRLEVVVPRRSSPVPQGRRGDAGLCAPGLLRRTGGETPPFRALLYTGLCGRDMF